MKVIIAGAGAVGTHLAKLLSGERHSIILIDESEERLMKLSSNFDLLTVKDSPTSIFALKNAGVEDADLFVAVMPEESRNITACMFANNLGAKKTVARIDNPEYLMPKNAEFLKKLGIHSLIYPEMLAARELLDAIRTTWLRQWWEFCGGTLVLVGTKMREGARILNIPLSELKNDDIPYHVVAIRRGNETIIPGGRDMLQENDMAYFTTTKEHVPDIRTLVGKDHYPEMRNVVIMGGSRIAVRVSQYAPETMRIKIIEKDLERCQWLTEKCDDDTLIINGDGSDMDFLKEEDIENAQAFVALTDNSETNILACLAAKRMGAGKTVAEVENMDYISMADSMDISTIINKKKIAASCIYQMLLDADVENVKCLTFANADVAEFVVKKGAYITKHPIKDIGLPKGITIGGMLRNDKGMLVTGTTQIQAGDHVVVFCLENMISKAEKFFR